MKTAILWYYSKKAFTTFFIFGILIMAFVASAVIAFFAADERRKFERQLVELNSQKASLTKSLSDVSQELATKKVDDQVVRNVQLADEIEKIHKTYNETVLVYEELLRVKDAGGGKSHKLDALFTLVLTQLSQNNYASASVTLSILKTEIQVTLDSLKTTNSSPQTGIVQSNDPPGSGYRRQNVSVDGTLYTVDVIAGDLHSTRVIVDTASTGDCNNDCPVLPLATYAKRNGAYAGINGSYFCPASYPSCADKKNSFDTLLMNKDKVYFNSANNIYSTVPAVIFKSGSVRFVGKSQEWGRDTGVDGVIANQPLLVSGGTLVFTGDGDPKKEGRGSRSFVANKGSVVYIGIIKNASVSESARVLKTMGMENGLNLDSGGSTALWFNGYKAGPGRDIPNTILFVRK